MQAVGFFWWPLLSIASFWSQFQDGLSAAERVFALIDAEPKVVQVAAEPVGTLEGASSSATCASPIPVPRPCCPTSRLSIRPKRDGGAGGPYRRGQEQHRAG
jgi:ABC-type multidrug transport system fused ATPase/permease subunit